MLFIEHWISQWEKFSETDRDYGREEKEYDEEHKSDSGDWEYDGDFKEKRKTGKRFQKG